MTGFQIYCILMLDGICFTSGIVFIIACAVLAGASLMSIFEKGETKAIAERYAKVLLVVTVVFGLTGVLTPNTKQAAMIYVLPKVINKVDTSQIPDKLMKLANKKLDQMIEEK